MFIVMEILATVLLEVTWKIGNVPVSSVIKLREFSGRIFKVSSGIFSLSMI